MVFTHPEYLWALLLLPLFPLIERSGFSDLSRWQRRFSLGWRLLLFTVIVLALAGIQIVRANPEQAVLFVVDLSDSVRDLSLPATREYYQEAIEGIKENDKAGLIVFGRESRIESLNLDKNSEFDVETEFTSLATDYTDLGKAINLALASFPDRFTKRIVLFTDGNQNLGDAVESAKSARFNDVRIDALPLSTLAGDDVRVGKVVLPDRVRENEPYEIRSIIESDRETRARLNFYRNGEFIGSREELLPQGRKSVAFVEHGLPRGFYDYEVEVESLDGADQQARNNRGGGFTIIEGVPKVLWLTEHPQKRSPLVGILASRELPVDRGDTSIFPFTMAELYSNYDIVILEDIPAYQLTDAQMQMLERFVSELGGGLVMLGSDKTFGVGGYRSTPIEKALPVSMDTTKRKSQPSTAIAMTLDKSGSMSGVFGGAQKIEIAKQAVYEVVDLLKASDQVGVSVFDMAAKEVVPISKLSNKGAINRLVAGIGAGGGTSMYAGMEMGYWQLTQADASVRHLIVLSDGISMGADFESLLKTMTSQSMTATFVAVGEDADLNTLNRLATLGNGRQYHAPNPQSIPRIFIREAFLTGNRAIIEDPFQPILVSAGEMLEGISFESAPMLNGFVTTTQKPTAQQLLTTDGGEPLLSAWHYGLGKSVAFTSDARDRWAWRWLDWSQFSRFWMQVLTWVKPEASSRQIIPQVTREGASATLGVDAVDMAGALITDAEITAKIIPPTSEPFEIRPEQTAPGRYEARFELKEPGSYMAAVTMKRGGETSGFNTTGFTMSYSPEYSASGTNTPLLARLAEITGGILSPRPEELFRPDPSRINKDFRDWWWTVVLIAMLAFPLDIALRRLLISQETFGFITAPIREVMNAGRQRAAVSQTRLSQLKAAKLRAGTRRAPAAPAARRQGESLKPDEPVPTGGVASVLKERADKEEEKTDKPSIADVLKQKLDEKAAYEAQQEEAAESGDGMSRLLKAKKRTRDKFDE